MGKMSKLLGLFVGPNRSVRQSEPFVVEKVEGICKGIGAMPGAPWQS